MPTTAHIALAATCRRAFAPRPGLGPNGTQYIGTLAAGADFPDLSFDLHVSVPVFDEYASITLDYTDPMAPTLVAEGTRYLQDDPSGAPRDAAQTWTRHGLATAPCAAWTPHPKPGQTGVPAFVQSPVFPSTPDGTPMAFLAQFASQPRMPGPTPDAPGLTFFGSGMLYLFWAAERRLLTAIIQDT
ncbi:hypothetical protein [Jannaschia pohangensis]|uniref:Uncharacterized protein n=1 Tax=Jannaschia pohangensis TaxID=390807 RepID=A0A1I3I059_9RHOB|nr:hypothetical protein [Jannaschia pohangensis]SFI41385.1 hypothetical protein SAMN04488095_0769 [Jannaschia pohangensis]